MKCRTITRKGTPCKFNSYRDTGLCRTHWDYSVGLVITGEVMSLEEGVRRTLDITGEPDLADYILEELKCHFIPTFRCSCGFLIAGGGEGESLFGQAGRSAKFCPGCGSSVTWVADQIDAWNIDHPTPVDHIRDFMNQE